MEKIVYVDFLNCTKMTTFLNLDESDDKQSRISKCYTHCVVCFIKMSNVCSKTSTTYIAIVLIKTSTTYIAIVLIKTINKLIN